MGEIKQTIATNLVELRKKHRMTQADLAIKLNYSDKAVSKWERGEAVPDIEILIQLCNLYGVDLNYLITEDKEEKKTYVKKSNKTGNKIVISLLSFSLVWFLAIFAYIVVIIVFNFYAWQLFIWALPVSSIVLIVFNGIWGKRRLIFPLVTVLTWTLLTSFYVQFLPYNLWMIFLLGIPSQIAIILWSQLS